MNSEDCPEGDKSFTLYRLQVALALPVSPYREALVRAIEKRLESEQSRRVFNQAEYRAHRAAA